MQFVPRDLYDVEGKRTAWAERKLRLKARVFTVRTKKSLETWKAVMRERASRSRNRCEIFLGCRPEAELPTIREGMDLEGVNHGADLGGEKLPFYPGEGGLCPGLEEGKQWELDEPEQGERTMKCCFPLDRPDLLPEARHQACGGWKTRRDEVSSEVRDSLEQ